MLEMFLSPPVLITAGVAALAIVTVLVLRLAIRFVLIISALAIAAVGLMIRLGIVDKDNVSRARDSMHQSIRRTMGAGESGAHGNR